MKIVCISDTHGRHWPLDIPDGDILIHAGDFTMVEGADIVVTHGPPYGVMDRVGSENVGCPELRRRLTEVGPRYHIFGHIHEHHGFCRVDDITHINASMLDGKYQPGRKAICFHIEDS